MKQSVNVLAIALCLILSSMNVNSNPVNDVDVEFGEVRKVKLSLNVESWWKNINSFLSGSDLNSVIGNLLKNELPNINEFKNYLASTHAETFRRLTAAVDIGRKIFGLQGNSLAELTKVRIFIMI